MSRSYTVKKGTWPRSYTVKKRSAGDPFWYSSGVNPRQTLKLVGTVEAVLEWGFSATSVLDPDKTRSIGQALLLTRCLRYELQRPGDFARRVAAATAGTQGTRRVP